MNYLENILPLKIIDNNDDLKDFAVIKCTATSGKSFDGFLSSIFLICLELEDKNTQR